MYINMYINIYMCVCVCVCTYEDREVYKDKDVNKEVPSNPSVLVNIVFKALRKTHLHGDWPSNIQHYFSC